MLPRAVLLAAALAFTAPALAQPAPPATPAQVEQRITQLHGQLRITPAEQPLWDQFATVMRSNAQAFSQAADERGAKLYSMVAPDIMQSYAGLSQLHAEQMQKLTAAFQALYNSFPDDQKHNADQVFQARSARAARARAR